MEAMLRDAVARATGRGAEGAPVVKLKGDASYRSYFRVGGFVVMQMPVEALKKSEEALSAAGAPPAEFPFINVHRYLRGLGVRVPDILLWDEARGVMVLEDLGDVTLERALLDGAPRAPLYGRAIDALADLRAGAERGPDPSCVAFQRAFDYDLYLWELHHFREYLLEARCGAKLTSAESDRLEDRFRWIAEQLAAEPRGFTHRDYQSRNIMILHRMGGAESAAGGGAPDAQAVIDFQDALQGPRQYDLVALLRDSYIVLEPPEIDALLDRYCARLGVEDRATFRRTFDLLTVQRKLKDAGRFEFIARVKGNPGFLPHVPSSLQYVKEALARLPELRDFHELLARHVPELR
jgi:hypothetical protein